jgi:hypothetical protein
MNTKTTIIFVALAAAALAVVLAPSLVATASAQITDVCKKNGRTSEGECTGNTDQNGKVPARQNPAGKEPPGQQP